MTLFLFALVIVLAILFACLLTYSHRKHKDALDVLRADFQWLEVELKILQGRRPQ